MPDPVDLLLIPILMAAGVSLAVMLLFWRRPDWGAALAVAAGAIAPFHWVVGAWPSFPAVDSKGWIFHVVIGAGLIAFSLAIARAPRWLHILVIIVLVGAGQALVLRHRLVNPDTLTPARAWMIGMIVAGVLWWFAFSANEGPARRLAPAAMLLFTTLVAFRILINGTLVYARLGLGIAGALAPIAVMGVLRPSFTSRSGICVFVAFLTNLLVAAIFDADMDWVDVVIFCLAPAGLVVASALEQKKVSWRTACISLICMALPLVVILVLRLPAFLHSLQVDESGSSY